MIDQQEGTEGERPGMALALCSLCRPSARAHLLTTGQGPAVVLPDGSRALSGGLGAVGHQQAAPGYIPVQCLLPLLSTFNVYVLGSVHISGIVI